MSARPQTAHGVVAKLNFSEKLDHRLAEQRAAWAPKPVTSAAVRVREALCDSSSRAIDLFRKWDADDSGTITKREWRRALPMLGLEISSAQSDAAFDALDPSDDGAIDYAELGKLLRRGNEAVLDAMLDEKMLPVAEAEAAAAAAEAEAAAAAEAEAAATAEAAAAAAAAPAAAVPGADDGAACAAAAAAAHRARGGTAPEGAAATRRRPRVPIDGTGARRGRGCRRAAAAARARRSAAGDGGGRCSAPTLLRPRRRACCERASTPLFC